MSDGVTRAGLLARLRNPAHSTAETQNTILHTGTACADMREAADEIDRLRAALTPFAEPHAMGDNYVRFAPRLIEAARKALNPST